MRRSLVLDTIQAIVFPSIMVLSVYLLFAGHNQPGGGFIGGLVAGVGFGLRFAAGGIEEVRRTSRIPAPMILGAGLVVAAVTAAVPLLFGAGAMETGIYEAYLGPIGKMKVTNALPFDIGVYLVVVGMALVLFEAFGDTGRTGDAS